MDSLKACDEDIRNGGKAYVYISFSDGGLHVMGHDIPGRGEEIFGSDDYEYYYDLEKSDTEKLLKQIGQELGRNVVSDYAKMTLIRDYFGEGLDFCKNLREYCEKNGLKCRFFCY